MDSKLDSIPQKLVNMLHVKPSDAVKDFGCEPGIIHIGLGEASQAVLSMDISLKMFEKPKAKQQKPAF